MNIKEFCEQINQVSAIIPDDVTTDIYITLESSYLFNKLNKILIDLTNTIPNAEISFTNTQVLIDLFQERWARIKNYRCHTYPYSYKTKAGQICLVVAQLLEPVLGKSRYQILMPSIEITSYIASTTELIDDAIELQQFILSTDKKRIIEIVASLDFAIEDGVLKYTDESMKPLDENEISQVINHSQETRLYCEAINKKILIETKGESFGAALNHLQGQLVSYGAHGGNGGQEMNAGSGANIAILKFSQWLEFLDQDERTNFLASTAPDLTIVIQGQQQLATLKDIWNRLARPTDTNYQSTIYCVELIAGHIGTILAHNQNLYNSYPKKSLIMSTIGGIESAKQLVKTTGERLKYAISSDQYKIIPIKNDKESNEFNKNVASIDDLAKYLVFSKADQLVEVIHRIPSDSNLIFLKQNISNQLRTMHVSWNKIAKIIVMHPSYEQWDNVKFFADLIIDKCIKDEWEFKQVINSFFGCRIIHLMEILDSHQPSFMQNINRLFVIYGILLLPESSPHYSTDHEAIVAYIVSKLESEEQMIKFSLLLPEAIRLNFIRYIDVKNKFTSWSNIKSILLALPLEGRIKGVNVFIPKIIIFINDNTKFREILKLFPSECILSLIKDLEKSIPDLIQTIDQLIHIYNHATNSFDRASIVAYLELSERNVSILKFNRYILSRNINDFPVDIHSFENSELGSSSPDLKVTPPTNSVTFNPMMFFSSSQNSQENTVVRKTIEILSSYGLTRDHIKKYLSTRSNQKFTEYEQDILVYLITGQPPAPRSFFNEREIKPIPEHARLTSKQAISEINGLSIDQNDILLKLYQFGLRGDHLRRWKPGTEGLFMIPHKRLLEKLIIEKGINPDEAIQQINGLSYDSARDIYFDRNNFVRNP